MPSFEETDASTLRRIIDEHPLASLVTAAGGELGAMHLPLILEPSRGPQGTLCGHLARGHAVTRAAGATVLAIFRAASAYVTPTWYPGKAEHGRVVPTWNYVVAQVSGELRIVDDPAWVLGHLQLLTDRREASRPRPWRVDDGPADFIEKLTSALVGIEIPIARLSGQRKASQNRNQRDRDGVRAGLLERDADGDREMAAWMK